MSINSYIPYLENNKTKREKNHILLNLIICMDF